MTMAAGLLHAPRLLARHDLNIRQAAALAAASLGAVTGLDLIDGRLGLAFSTGFVLIVATVPVAVRRDGFFAAGMLPPVLFGVAILIVSAFAGSALVLEGTPEHVGLFGRALSGAIAFGVPLLIGYALALGVIALRVLRAP